MRRGGHGKRLVKKEKADILKQIQNAISEFCPELTCTIAPGIVGSETLAPKFCFSKKPPCLRMKGLLSQASGTKDK